jgi:hypothetical protein
MTLMSSSDKIIEMARRKRHYKSTRIKLDMSFEEALTKLCQSSWHAESEAAPKPDATKGDTKINRKPKRKDQ